MIRQDFDRGWVYYREGTSDKNPVTLPHDAMIHEEECGPYIYEKTFFVSYEQAEETFRLEFNGVYRWASVYLNGVCLADHVNGLLPFEVCLDPALCFGEMNELRVCVDNAGDGEWNCKLGGGLCGAVHLLVSSKEHILREGIRITTESVDPIRIRIVTALSCDQTEDMTARIDIRDMEGMCVASGEGLDIELEIPEGKVWTPEHPEIYRCLVSLLRGNELLDQSVELFGIRTIHWGKDGFFVNGEPVVLRGACISHDNGILGACAYREAEERKIHVLKKNGFNAVRVSGYPASRALLAACDRVGMYVIDEYSIAEIEEELLLSAMVMQDFNHPSVIMYSVGGKLEATVPKDGPSVLREAVDEIHRMDPTRPVTGAVGPLHAATEEKSGGILGVWFQTTVKSLSASKKRDLASSALDLLDIVGCNASVGKQYLDGDREHLRPVVGLSFEAMDIGKSWEIVKKHPHVIGAFVQDGWASIHKRGAIDITGYAGAPAHYVSSIWNQSEHPYIGVRPVKGPVLPADMENDSDSLAFAGWSWKGCEGMPTEVAVYAASDKARFVKLYLNGHLVGKKDFARKQAFFRLNYGTGTLTAVTYDGDGNKLGGRMLMSAAGEIHLVVKTEKRKVAAGEIVFVHTCVHGSNGVVESNCDQTVRITVEHGELLGYGSARPKGADSYHTGVFTTWYGRSLALIRADGSGDILVKAESDEMSSSLIIEVE